MTETDMRDRFIDTERTIEKREQDKSKRGKYMRKTTNVDLQTPIQTFFIYYLKIK